MKKRCLAFLLALSLVTAFCAVPVFALEDRASKTLSSYLGVMKAGSKSGELRISYEVHANTTADSVGVSSIALYNSGGVYMTTILGSTDNGLIDTDCVTCAGTYSHTAVPGNSYYAAITVFAQIGDEYDSRVITTKIVTAPTTP